MRSAVFTMLAALAGGALAQAAEPAADQPWLGARLAYDTGSVLAAPAHWDVSDWAAAGACVGGTILLGVAFDRPVQRFSQAHRSPGLDRWSTDVGLLGGIGSFAILGSTGAAAWVRDDDRLANATIDGLEASIISGGLITPALKAAIGRTRPREAGDRSDHVAPFSGKKSFPSGHATQAFTVAAAYAASYPDEPWVGIAGYGAAAAVGAARIEQNAHYLSDVIAGAVIGTCVGIMTVHLNAARRDPIARHSPWIPASVTLAEVDGRPALGLAWAW